MRLISSKDTLDFLEHAAPRAWAKRMLAWMCATDELRLFARAGNVVGVASLISALADEQGFDPGWGMVERDEFIRRRFNTEAATKFLGKRLSDQVEDEAYVWTEDDEPIQISVGTLLFADELDWDANRIAGLYFGDTLKDNSDIFWDSETVFVSALSRPDYRVTLSGLSLELDRIELLRPQGLGDLSAAALHPAAARRGRPAKWDWEGAITAMIGEAQHPDGLPTGAGAQAEVERRMATWFVQQTGDSPAASQIRGRAARVMQALEKPESR